MNSTPSKSYRDVVSKDSRVPPTTSVDSPLTPQQEAVLQQRFPTRVLLDRDKVANSTAFWKNAVIGKPLGRNLPMESMEAALNPQWSNFGDWELFPMSYGLFLFRFASPEIRDTVLLGGPWVVDGAALALSPFVPEFRPHPSHITRAVIWVRLPDLPPSVWSSELITDILGVVGRVVRLDDDTEQRRRGKFARAAVEVDLTHPLLPGVAVDVEDASLPSFWQQFRYEHLHSFCNRCRRVGHRSFECAEQPSSPRFLDEDDGLPDLLVRRRPPPRTAPQARSSSIHHSRSHTSTSPRALNPNASPVVGGPTPCATADLATTPSSIHHNHSRTSPSPRAFNPNSSPAVVGPTPCATPACASSKPDDGADVTADVIAAARTSPARQLPSSHGPSTVGPGVPRGPSSPHIPSTSANGPKHFEPVGSSPSSFVQPEQHCEGEIDGALAINEVSERERHLIQQIMEDDSDSVTDFVDDTDFIEDDVIFTTVGKKKKSKGKFPAICLRPAPRDRTNMKRAKFVSPSSAGKFSLLADILGGMSPEDIAARHGPPEG